MQEATDILKINLRSGTFFYISLWIINIFLLTNHNINVFLNIPIKFRNGRFMSYYLNVP